MIKYENPRLIDLDFKNAIGACISNGSGDLNCTDGFQATHGGRNSCNNGDTASGHCNAVGTGALTKCSSGAGH